MGRGRGKGRKLTVGNHDDTGSGEEEKIPAQKRRGRPQKPLKDEIDEEEAEKIEEEEEEKDEDVESEKSGVTNKEAKSPNASENGKKRKRNSQVKEKPALNQTLMSQLSQTGSVIAEADGRTNLVELLNRLWNASEMTVLYRKT